MVIENSSNQRLGAFFAIASGLCYGLLGYFGVTLMQAGLSVFSMLFWRFLVSFTVLALFVLYTRHPVKLDRQSLRAFLLGGTFGIGAPICYFFATAHLGSGLAMVMFFAYPAVVMLVNTLYYKTKMQPIDGIALLLLMIGTLCLVDVHELVFDVEGVLLGLLAAISYAFYVITSKHSTITPALSSLMVSAGSMTSCGLLALATLSFSCPGPAEWPSMLALGILCTAMPIMLLFKALQYISTEKASMLSVLEPIFVLFFGIILLDEAVTITQIVGSAIMLTAAMLTLLPARVRDDAGLTAVSQ